MCLLFHLPALCPSWQKIPGGQRDPVLLSVGFGIVAPVRQRNPAAQDPEGSTKPSDPQNWPAGHTRHSPENTDWQLWPQSKQQNKLPARGDQSPCVWVWKDCTPLKVSMYWSKINWGRSFEEKRKFLTWNCFIVDRSDYLAWILFFLSEGKSVSNDQ